MNRVLPRFPRGHAGFTLVETLVTVVMMLLIGTILSTVMINSMRTSQRQQDQTATLSAAKVAMERMTREVRGANSLVAATPRSLTVVETIGGVRHTTTLAVAVAGSGTEIRQTVVSKDLSTGVETTVPTRVLGGLAVGRSEAVFSYTDGAGVALAPATASPITYNAGDVKTITIRVVMKRKFGAPPLELEQLVSIRNLE